MGGTGLWILNVTGKYAAIIKNALVCVIWYTFICILNLKLGRVFLYVLIFFHAEMQWQ